MLQVGWSVEDLARVHRHARSHVPALFRALRQHYAAAAGELLWPVCSWRLDQAGDRLVAIYWTCATYVSSPAPALCRRCRRAALPMHIKRCF